MTTLCPSLLRSGPRACFSAVRRCANPKLHLARRTSVHVRASLNTKEADVNNAKTLQADVNNAKTEAELTTEKMGLEAGLFKVMTSQDEEGKPSRTEQAKQLLTKYGSAYLITSITFAIISFAACYFAVDAGLDVAGLLAKVGLEVNNTSESVGTFAIAYAAHKALSPIRFPPTVALTPVVAKWLGNKKE